MELERTNVFCTVLVRNFWVLLKIIKLKLKAFHVSHYFDVFSPGPKTFKRKSFYEVEFVFPLIEFFLISLSMVV